MKTWILFLICGSFLLRLWAFFKHCSIFQFGSFSKRPHRSIIRMHLPAFIPKIILFFSFFFFTSVHFHTATSWYDLKPLQINTLFSIAMDYINYVLWKLCSISNYLLTRVHVSSPTVGGILCNVAVINMLWDRWEMPGNLRNIDYIVL